MKMFAIPVAGLDAIGFANLAFGDVYVDADTTNGRGSKEQGGERVDRGSDRDE